MGERRRSLAHRILEAYERVCGGACGKADMWCSQNPRWLAALHPMGVASPPRITAKKSKAYASATSQNQCVFPLFPRFNETWMSGPWGFKVAGPASWLPLKRPRRYRARVRIFCAGRFLKPSKLALEGISGGTFREH